MRWRRCSLKFDLQNKKLFLKNKKRTPDDDELNNKKTSTNTRLRRAFGKRNASASTQKTKRKANHDDGDDEFHFKKTPTPCLWKAPASTQKTRRETRPIIRRSTAPVEGRFFRNNFFCGNFLSPPVLKKRAKRSERSGTGGRLSRKRACVISGDNIGCKTSPVSNRFFTMTNL